MKFIRGHILEILLGIISFILLLLMVLPYLSGYKIQSDYSQLIKLFSKGNALSFEVISYERHWFKSDAMLIVKDQERNVLFEFSHQIIHGPLYLGLVLDGHSPFVNMVIKGGASLDKLPSEIYSVFLEPENQVNINAYVGFNSDIVAKFSILEANINNELHTKLNQKIELNLQYDSQNSHYKGEVLIPRLASNDETFFELENFTLNFDEQYNNKVASGDVVLSFDLLKLKLNSRILDFRKVSARFENSIVNELLDVGFDINVSKINLFNEQINSLSFGLEAEKFNLQFMDQMHVGFNGYVFQSLKIKPFDLYTEHGVFSAHAVIKSNLDDTVIPKNFFSDKSTSLEAVLSMSLLRRIYEVVSLNSVVPMKNVDAFVKKIFELKYVDRDLSRVRLKVSAMNNVFIVNDVKTDFDHLRDEIMSSVLPN